MMREEHTERIKEIEDRLRKLEHQPSASADEMNALRDELSALQAQPATLPQSKRPRYKAHLEFDVPSAATPEPEPYDWGETPTLLQYEEPKIAPMGHRSAECGSVRCFGDENNPIDEERESQLDELNKLLEENKGISLSEAIKKAQQAHRSL